MNEIKLPAGDKLVLSSSPHISNNGSVRNIMLKVLLALLPAAGAGIWFFGLRALLVIIVTVASCMAVEALWCKLAGKSPVAAVCDGSAAVTGLLLALNFPAAVPLYVPVIGAFLAIWLGKQVFGGLGHNPFNPAIVARVGLLIALPAAMTTFTPPRGMDKSYPEAEIFFGSDAMSRKNLDGISCATPLGAAGALGKSTTGATPKAEKKAVPEETFRQITSPELMKKYFWGIRSGCIGETCVPAILLGGLLLLFFRLIKWQIPVFFIGSAAAVAWGVNHFCPGITPPPLFHLLTGGLLLGAIFMATDMVTSPVTPLGCIIFGTGCGVITAVIRIWGNYPEGVSFGILFMNALVPLIDSWFTRRPLGYNTGEQTR